MPLVAVGRRRCPLSAQLSTYPCATISVGSDGAWRPGSMLIAAATAAFVYGVVVVTLHLTGVPDWVPGWVPLWR